MAEAAPARVRLLVVDDELYNRDLMMRTFARDCDVVAAAGVADALDVLARSPIDAVLTDQALVGELGTELAREVRARWPAVRVVVVTGFDGDSALSDAVRGGFVDEIVAKPWKPAALRAKVLALVGR
jgi:CheY-like chemotaxis protein